MFKDYESSRTWRDYYDERNMDAAVASWGGNMKAGCLKGTAAAYATYKTAPPVVNVVAGGVLWVAGAIAAATVVALSAPCPSVEPLSQPWIEHAGPLPDAVLDSHLRSKNDGAGPMLLPVNTVSWWIGASRSGRGDAEGLGAPGCFVLGSAAFYANGLEDSPAVDFVKVVGSGAERSLRGSLIELRWYDAKDGRKHRWFNAALARRLGWDVDGRGAPTDTPRPIPLPDAINELL